MAGVAVGLAVVAGGGGGEVARVPPTERQRISGGEGQQRGKQTERLGRTGPWAEGGKCVGRAGCEWQGRQEGRHGRCCWKIDR